MNPRQKGDNTMTSRRIGTREEWAAASTELLKREKEHTRAGDELARQRRELPLGGEIEKYLFNHLMRMAQDETAGENS